MSKMVPIRRYANVGFLVLGLVLIIVSNVWLPKGSHLFKPTYLSPPQVQRITFGHQEQVADIFWLRAVQDMDYCENKVSGDQCRGRSWLFRILDLVTDLAPRFRMPYAVGGLALSVLISDYAGASRIFDKGTAAFPKDWPILSRAAYHALYEENNKTKAAQLMEQVANHGGPIWYRSLAARLYIEGNQMSLAFALLEELRANPQVNDVLIRRIEKKIAELRKSGAN